MAHRYIYLTPRQWQPTFLGMPRANFKCSVGYFQTYTLYRSCLCTVPTQGPVFFKLIWETKTVLTFFQRSLKTKYKLALLPPWKYTKTLLYYHIGIQVKQLRSLKMSLQSVRSNLKKTLEGPQYFVSVGSVANENPSELRGLGPYQNAVARLVIVFSNV